MLLSTLRTLRYRSARKTRSRPARYGFGRTELSSASHRQLLLTHSQAWCRSGARFALSGGYGRQYQAATAKQSRSALGAPATATC